MLCRVQLIFAPFSFFPRGPLKAHVCPGRIPGCIPHSPSRSPEGGERDNSTALFTSREAPCSSGCQGLESGRIHLHRVRWQQEDIARSLRGPHAAHPLPLHAQRQRQGPLRRLLVLRRQPTSRATPFTASRHNDGSGSTCSHRACQCDQAEDGLELSVSLSLRRLLHE